MVSNKEMVTAQDLAGDLGLSVETIWKYTRERKIPFIELGNRRYRYNLSHVIRALDNSKINETKADYGKISNNFTYQDYLEYPAESGYQYEVLEGTLVKEPSPNVIHQRVSRRLQRILEFYFWEVDPEGEVFNAPLDITLSDINVVQPDIFYIPGIEKNIIKEKRIDGPPFLVVEILSPYNYRKDRVRKMQVYQEAHIKHYWLVNPEERTLECFALRDEVYAVIASGMEGDYVKHPQFTNLEIYLSKLW